MMNTVVRDHRWPGIAIGLTAAAVILQIWMAVHLGGFWRDEVSTLNLATLPLNEAIPLFRHDGYPPLFAFLLRGWTLSGRFVSPTWLRLFGLGVGIAILCSLWITSRWTGSRYPVIGLLLVALNPAVLRWGEMLRPPGLSLALTILTVGAMGRLIRRDDARSMTLATATSVLTVSLVYQNALTILGLCLAGIIVALATRRRRLAWRVLLVGLVAAFSMLPNIALILAQRDWLSAPTSPDMTAAAILGLALREYGPFIALGPLIIVALRPWLTGSGPHDSADKGRVLVGTFDALVALSCAGTIAAFLVGLPFQPSIWYYFPVLGVIGATLDTVFRQSSRLRLLVATSALLALPTLSGWSLLRQPQTNVDRIAAIISEQGGAEDLVLVEPWQVGITFDYYYTGMTPWMTLPPVSDLRVHRWDLAGRSDSTPNRVRDRVIRTIAIDRRVWWIGFGAPRSDELRSALGSSCEFEPVSVPENAMIWERMSLGFWAGSECVGAGQ